MTHRDSVILMSVDDKAKVAVGNAGQNISTGARPLGQYAHQGADMARLDHDFSPHSITPSATLVIDIPEAAGGKWYHGALHVGLKDSVFETSEPFRHAEELKRIYKFEGTKRSGERAEAETVVPYSGGPPVLVVYSDGGPDRMLSRASVLVANIVLFLELDLDMMVLARTVPGLSFNNWVERCMSGLNRGIMNTTLMLDDSTKESGVGAYERFFEALPKLNNTKDIREAAEKWSLGADDFKLKYKTAIRGPIDQLANRLRHITWAQEPVVVYDTGTPEEIESLMRKFFEAASKAEFGGGPARDAALQRLRQAGDSLSPMAKNDINVLNSGAFGEFRKRHVIETPYMMQFIKVPGCSCTMCKAGIIKPPRHDQFHEQFGVLPLPQKHSQSDEHFRAFAEVYAEGKRNKATVLQTKYMPSLASSGITYNAVRGIATVRCSECSKPRIVYRADGVAAGGRKETSLDRKLFNVLSEQGLYACGKTVQDMVNSVRTRDHVANMMEKIGMQGDSSENAAAWIGLVARVTKSYVVGAWVCIQGMEKNYWIAQNLGLKDEDKNICTICGLPPDQVSLPTTEDVIRNDPSLNDRTWVRGACLACSKENPKNKNVVLFGNRQGQGKMRKRKVVPPEAAAAPAAAESSASEEEDSSVSDDFQP